MVDSRVSAAFRSAREWQDSERADALRAMDEHTFYICLYLRSRKDRRNSSRRCVDRQDTCSCRRRLVGKLANASAEIIEKLRADRTRRLEGQQADPVAIASST
jgi:hypothetical protein